MQVDGAFCANKTSTCKCGSGGAAPAAPAAAAAAAASTKGVCLPQLMAFLMLLKQMQLTVLRESLLHQKNLG